MNSFSFKREGFLRGSLLVFLFLFSLGINGCEDDESPPPPAPTCPEDFACSVDPEPPPATKTMTITDTIIVEPGPPMPPAPVEPEPTPVVPTQAGPFTVKTVFFAVINNGIYGNPAALDVTESVEVFTTHGDEVVFTVCDRTGACSSTDTVSFVYYGEDFEPAPDQILAVSQRQYGRQKYLDLPEEILLASFSQKNLFREHGFDCEDVSVPMIISASNDTDDSISDDFEDATETLCVYSSGRVLYVSGWIWDYPGVPSLSSEAFTNCEGFVLWCVRDLAVIHEDPNWNDDIPSVSSSHPSAGPTIVGNSFAAPRVGVLADWMRRWFDVEETITGTLQVLALVRAFAEDLGDPGIDCEWGTGRVDADFFAPVNNPEGLSGGYNLVEEYQLINRRPITVAYLSEKLEEKGFTGTFQEQLEKLEWRYRNEANATDSDKEDGYGEVLEFPDCN